jgi:hypothetical protein
VPIEPSAPMNSAALANTTNASNSLVLDQILCFIVPEKPHRQYTVTRNPETTSAIVPIKRDALTVLVWLFPASKAQMRTAPPAATTDKPQNQPHAYVVRVEIPQVPKQNHQDNENNCHRHPTR